MKIISNSLILACVALSLSSCATLSSSYYQPPPDAVDAWHMQNADTQKVRKDLASCNYIDNVTQISEQQFRVQTQCMKDKGYQIDTKRYNPHNCYGNAPAMCRLVW
ncbi:MULTISPECIES: hypothetical protein [unclassified Acinetobacter]|uniref:hypothetical protein n=1 Tax=unclassified Acinetobacter TaxID=196816 RepID=UPI0035B784E5